MGLHRIGSIALVSGLATVLNVDVGLLIVSLHSNQALEKPFIQQVLAQTWEERSTQANQLLQQGVQEFSKGQFAAALQSWQQARSLYREIGNRQGEGEALGNIGIAYSNLGNYAQAIAHFQQSLAIAREIGNRQEEGRALGNLGLVYLSLGDYTRVIDYQQQSLAIARELGNREGEGQSLGNLGLAYLSLGEYSEAIHYLQQWLAIAREIGDRQGEGRALGNLGLAYLSLGEYSEAVDRFQQSLAIAREAGNRHSEEAALGNLGLASFYLGDYAQAIDYQQQSLAIARAIGNRQGEGNALGNLGLAYLHLGEYTRAIAHHEQHLAIARELGNRRGEGAALGNLGIAYGNRGDYARAIEYQQQSLAIAREIGNRQGEGEALGNLGLAYLDLGDYARAIDYQQQRLALVREMGERQGEGNALGNLGIAYSHLGDYTRAIDYYQQSLALAREVGNRQGEGNALGNLGLAYYSLGNYARAIEYQQQSLAIAREIGDRASEGNALGNLGLAYLALGDDARALDYPRQWLAIAREMGDRANEGKALNNLGVAFYQAGNLAAAEETLFESLEVLESIRTGLGSDDTVANNRLRLEADANKVSIFDTQARSYRTLQQVLIAQNKTHAALEVAEWGRARAFVELLAMRLSPERTEPVTPPTVEEVKRIAKAQNATLVQYSIILENFPSPGQPEVRESALYIWVIQPTGEIAFRQVDLKPLWQQSASSLAELVLLSRHGMGVRGIVIASVAPRPGLESQPQANLRQLHQILIEPIANLLPSHPEARVIFIPQGSLFLVPFPALTDRQGNYLIENHTLLTAPSIQVLQLTREQREQVGISLPGNDALVVGNPTMPSVPPGFGTAPQPLPPLPGSEREANAIASLLNTQPLIGKDATEATIKARLPQARYVHFATHGLLDEIRGLGSALALAPSEGRFALTPDSPVSPVQRAGEDGLLTAEELLEMKLNAELVVLSACDTGRGRITGDGVVGLSRSFISAGVPSILVSLWQVPDDSTAFLMREFYEHLEQTPDKAQALRQGMLATMQREDYSHPRQWAAFTLIGEAE